MYSKEMTLKEVYETSPIARDILNEISVFADRKYGYCAHPHVNFAPVQMVAYTIEHAVKVETFDRLMDVINRNPMQIIGKQNGPAYGILKEAVMYECASYPDVFALEQACELGMNMILFAWDLDMDEEEAKAMFEAAKEKGIAVILKLNLKNVDLEEAMKKMDKWIKDGASGFCVEEADLIIADKVEKDTETDFRRIHSVWGLQDAVFAPEIENYLQKIMKEVILPNRAFLFGKMTYDGIATSARRCEGEDRALDLVMTKLHLDGIEDKSLGHVDLNDYKQMMINRYEDMPGYWPVLSTETIDGSVLSELVVEKSEDQEKAAKLLAVLMHTLKGSPCTVQGEEAGVELFYRDLLELRRNHKALARGEMQISNKKLFDIMTYKRFDEAGNTYYVECNISANENVIAPERPEGAELLLSNYEDTSKMLRPYEANIYKVK